MPSGSTSPVDEQSHFELVSEEKRRRNTAASGESIHKIQDDARPPTSYAARFRNKRKQATLNLERSISDLSGRAADLEREAADLRRENGWLKEIVILKSHRAALAQDRAPDSGSKGGGSGRQNNNGTE